MMGRTFGMIGTTELSILAISKPAPKVTASRSCAFFNKNTEGGCHTFATPQVWTTWKIGSDEQSRRHSFGHTPLLHL
jgi:hypothetical protein